MRSIASPPGSVITSQSGYIVTIAGLFILRKREPETPRPYRAFGYPLVPALYILCALGFCVNLLVNKPDFTVGSLVIVGLGAVVFFVTGMNKPSTKDLA